MMRHRIKPGMTGLAQVEGARGKTETLEKMAGRVELGLKIYTSHGQRLNFFEGLKVER